MQEYVAKYAIQICSFLAAYLLWPLGKWVKSQFDEKRMFKDQLKDIKGEVNLLKDRAKKTDENVDKLHVKFDANLSSISSSLKQLEINTAVNTTKIDNKK